MPPIIDHPKPLAPLTCRHKANIDMLMVNASEHTTEPLEISEEFLRDIMKSPEILRPCQLSQSADMKGC